MTWITTKVLAYLLAATALFGGVQTLRLAMCQRDEAKQQAVWAEAYANAIRKVLQQERSRNRASEAAADAMREKSDAALPEMQRVSSAAAERVRTVIQRIEVPMGCPTTLPPEVQAEGEAAVERARNASK